MHTRLTSRLICATSDRYSADSLSLSLNCTSTSIVTPNRKLLVSGNRIIWSHHKLNNRIVTLPRLARVYFKRFLHFGYRKCVGNNRNKQQWEPSHPSNEPSDPQVNWTLTHFLAASSAAVRTKSSKQLTQWPTSQLDTHSLPGCIFSSSNNVNCSLSVFNTAPSWEVLSDWSEQPGSGHCGRLLIILKQPHLERYCQTGVSSQGQVTVEG